MNLERNPQAQQMGDASMVRSLAHQAEAIWPQECLLFDRYCLSGPLRILDLGCGTGEITRRLAERYPQATVLGVDILESNVEHARRQSLASGERIRYARGDAFALDLVDASFDLVACRHVSQSVPDFARVLAEIARVLKPGGRLHLLSEDYGMLQFPAGDGGDFDPDLFWNGNVVAYMRSVGCDGRVGRHSPPLLEAGGYHAIAVDYITVDTLRVPRTTFVGILEAWRDGYAPALAVASGRSEADVHADFETMIRALRGPSQYAVWHVPVVSARRPATLDRETREPCRADLPG